MNYNPHPRESFLSEATAAISHRSLAENAFLRKAMGVALAEYSRSQSEKQATDLGGAASCFMRIQGAHELVDTFYNLAETAPVPVTRDVLNLPSNVKAGPTKRN